MRPYCIAQGTLLYALWLPEREEIPKKRGYVCKYIYGGGLVAKLCPILVTTWTVARQAPVSMGFSRQEHWSGLPFHSPGY